MKKLVLKPLALMAVASVVLLGCNPLSKMAKNSNAIKYTLNPDPLEMHGDTVAITVAGSFPANFFHKKAIVEVTPILTNPADGSVIKEFKPITLIGDAADGDGKKISWEKGGSFNYSEALPYDASMDMVNLEVKAVAKYKTKTKEFDGIKVGDGTIVTPLWVQSDERPILGKDKFIKVIPRSVDAQINYLVNSSYVRPGEMREDDMKAVKTFISEGVDKDYVFKGLTVSAYASPDGEIRINDDLANDRAKSAAASIKAEMKRKKIEAAKDDNFYQTTGKGEDWVGFKEKMQASSIGDKQTIIRILEMYKDPDQREKEIKALAVTYKEIANDILPQLRRSQLTLNAEEQARSDAEITRLVGSSPDSLSVEEILYAATLTNDMNEKLSIYKKAQNAYPQDWRGWNNAGYIYLLQNNLNNAEDDINQANKLDGNNAVVKNNMGIIARLKGDNARARDLYTEATSAGKDVYYNLGILNIMSGDYGQAVDNMSGVSTFNSALANLLDGDNESALRLIDASDDKSSAAGYYLKAIIGARTDNKDLLMNNLRTAISKDSSLKDKAKKDAEFLKYRENADFGQLVN